MNISQKHKKRLGVSMGTWQLFKKHTIEMFGTVCVYCGHECTQGLDLTIDHILPLSKGGKTKVSNLAPTCGECNQLKKNKIWKPLTEF